MYTIAQTREHIPYTRRGITTKSLLPVIHGLCYTSRGVLALTRNDGPPRGIDLMIHSTISRHCTTELHFAPYDKRPQWFIRKEERKEMFYLMTHSTPFIYGYMASNIAREDTRCRHFMGYSFRLAARDPFYMHHRTDRIAYTTTLYLSWSTGWNDK